MAKLDMRTGSTAVMVLRLLAEKPMYGYQIVKELQARSEGYFNIEQGTLYPALHRMQRRGWIEAEWGLSETKRKAKYYRLTRSGRKHLQDQQ